MEPRAASYRTLAALGYLPPVAIAVLLMPSYRGVRHLRFHALQSLALLLGAIGGAVLLGWAGAILGRLPFLGLFLLGISGLAISLWMVGALGVAVYAAVMAYQGRTTRLPLLDRQLRRLDRHLERRWSTPELGGEVVEKRVRRRRPRTPL
ncbi:hypothetical protein J7643_15360 [bacterium]|nr:hypothetical protein [bacterium]